MKIAILSDTHGNYASAVRVLTEHGDVDQIIHLGDTSDDAQIIELAIGHKLIIISGNCDTNGKYPESVSMVIAGKKFFITHGDGFQVKAGLIGLYRKARQDGVDVVLYGHTHMPCIEEIDGILFMNPGALKKDGKNPSMGIIHIEDSLIRAEIISVKPPGE